MTDLVIKYGIGKKEVLDHYLRKAAYLSVTLKYEADSKKKKV